MVKQNHGGLMILSSGANPRPATTGYNSMSMSSDVLVFQKASEQNASKENAELYEKLIEEEYNEFLAAVGANNEVETLDACMDMIWVILGYCHMKGYKVDQAWAEVARSNHAKIDNKTGKVLKREDGKVLKPNGWTPPNLMNCIEY